MTTPRVPSRHRTFRFDLRRAVVLGLALTPLLAGCGVDAREFEAPPLAMFGGAGAAGGSGLGQAGSGGAPGSSVIASVAGAGATPVVEVLNTGAACISDDRCESGNCEATAVDGALVCCAGACAADARCRADGLACEPVARLRGESCSESLACAAGLTCAAADAAQNVCCASACNPGEFCVEGGARCLAPLGVAGSPCTEGGQCVSGYCDVDRRVCAANPCLAGGIVGSYCGRGSQCDVGGQCTFTAMGMLAAGGAHTCAILSSGGVRCWGENSEGALGALPENADVGDTLDEIPSQVPGLQVTFGTRRAVQVAAGTDHSCALLDDGNVRCWGQASAGQLAPVRTDGDIFLPVGERAVQIDAGGAHTCALLASGGVACWGDNSIGQLGIGTNTPIVPTAAMPAALLTERASYVTAGTSGTCAILEGGGLTCWGGGQNGTLGYAESGNRLAPGANVDVGGAVSYVTAAGQVTCAVITGGFVRCWGGARVEGVLGYGHTDDIGLTETPAQAATLLAANGRPLGGNVQLGGGGVVQVETSLDTGHVCARFAGGAVRCWGNNEAGTLGYGHEEVIGDDETPAEAAQLRPDRLGGDVPFGRTVLALATGGRCAVLNDRSVICWGRNTQGQLGMPALYPDGTPDLTPQELIEQGIGPVSVE